MNSFKNLHDGLAYEIIRQAEVLEAGGHVAQETRHWEPATKRTISMRMKETADDYRYFPEPDLAPFDLSDEFIEGVRQRLPELPEAKKARFVRDYELSATDAGNLAADSELAKFFETALRQKGDGSFLSQGGTVQVSAIIQDKNEPSPFCLAFCLAKPIANLLLNDVAAHLNTTGETLDSAKFTPAHIAELAELTTSDTISSKQSKEVFAAMTETGASPQEIAKERGMQQISDVGALEAAIAATLAANPSKVAEYKDGKTGLIGFFVGQVMRETKGQGNPKLINEILAKKLST
jgi:aspartyl-tRNA(Asn)/glutamyl-tRNA(Gln) amidotransferase subunit B